MASPKKSPLHHTQNLPTLCMATRLTFLPSPQRFYNNYCVYIIPLCNFTCSLVQPTTKTSSILQLSFIFSHSLAPFSFPFLSPVFSRLLVFEVVFLHPGVYHLKGPLYPLGAPHSFPCPFLGHYISYFLLLLGQ